MKTAKVITGVIIVLIAALAVGLIFKFTNGFNEEFKTFYLEQDGKQILTSETERSFLRGESYRYEVKYTFDSGKSESKGYNVKVVPNVKFNLTFNADRTGRGVVENGVRKGIRERGRGGRAAGVSVYACRKLV